ncbi:MAG TPA: helix-turn-helix domain-containing protein [Acidimicrobiia bacterium]|nr:helix-turn-helix domain-containing protein [Acidimicrobiia bacterium]
MQVFDERHSSGIADLDRHLDSLLAGDNLVWVGDDPILHDLLEHRFLTAEGDTTRALVLLEGEDPRLPGVDLVDARAGNQYADLIRLEQKIIDLGREPGARIVIRDLDVLVRRLGEEGAVAFFTRTCPRLFDMGAIAYWRASRAGSGRILDGVQRVTQCLIDMTGGRMRIRKAEGRPGTTGQVFDITVDDGRLQLEEVRAASRLAEGLRRVRTERGLTQTEVARLAGVSPSAISQAESGYRGLGIDTLLTLSEALGVSLDDLFAHSPDTGYVLARRDRIPPRRGIVALLDDPNAGLRAHLITLGPGETGGPPVVHKGAELVMVSAGLVQIVLNEEAPVMRTGDALLVTRDAINGWRNLLPDPARLFWIVRD